MPKATRLTWNQPLIGEYPQSCSSRLGSLSMSLIGTTTLAISLASLCSQEWLMLSTLTRSMGMCYGWMLQKEMEEAVQIAFEVHPESITHIPGFKKIPGHVVWDVKMDFTWTIQYVAGGTAPTHPSPSLTPVSFCENQSELHYSWLPSTTWMCVLSKTEPLFNVLSNYNQTYLVVRLTQDGITNHIYPSFSWLVALGRLLQHELASRLMTSHPGYLLTSPDHG